MSRAQDTAEACLYAAFGALVGGILVLGWTRSLLQTQLRRATATNGTHPAAAAPAGAAHADRACPIIKAHCRTCGDVTVPATALHVELHQTDPSVDWYGFTCPKCGERQTRSAAGDTLRELFTDPQVRAYAFVIINPGGPGQQVSRAVSTWTPPGQATPPQQAGQPAAERLEQIPPGGTTDDLLTALIELRTISRFDLAALAADVDVRDREDGRGGGPDGGQA